MAEELVGARVAYDSDNDPWYELDEERGLFQQGGTTGDGDQLSLSQIAQAYGLNRVVTVAEERERDLLLWLHAEADWQRDRLAINYTQSQFDLDAAEREASWLRREVEFEAHGASTFSGADARADGDCVTFVAEDFGIDVDTDAGGIYVSLNHRRAARTEEWGDDVSVDYDSDGIPTGVEILRTPRPSGLGVVDGTP